VPLNRLHVETDSPFLAPVPYGKANEPLVTCGEFVAELRDESFVELREARVRIRPDFPVAT